MATPDPTDPPLWHALDSEQALARLQSGAGGLSRSEAERRLAEHGPNRLPEQRGRSAWRRFLSQFNNVLIYVLLAAAAVTGVFGHYADTGVILGVVVINALIGFIQEGKAERALDAIRQMLSQQATVLRDGHRTVVPAEAVVPGDLVIVQSGDRVPADLRLIHVHNLQVDEAALTGESVPVEKSVSPAAPEAAIGDRSSMAFSGTLVTYGQATGLIVATGASTEIGRISALIAGVKKLTTPLLRQIDRFGRALSAIILVLALATGLVGILARGFSVDEMFLAAVGLAVAAIPEGLPAIISITLAIGVQRMAGRNAIIRRLPAVETLGSVSVICTDKTGTLTRNEMTAQEVATADALFEVGGVGYDPHGAFSLSGEEIDPAHGHPGLLELCRAALLCNDASLHREGDHYHLQGDPTEGALVALAMKAGLDPRLVSEEYPRTDVIPFESEHRFMATLHHDHAGHAFIIVKGAPERILEACTEQRSDGQDIPLNIDSWHRRAEAMAARGQRLLAVAFKAVPAETTSLRFEDATAGLTLIGFVGLIDPPRDEAITAVARCLSAGIQVKMITGDHAITAGAIAGQMGIPAERVLTGRDLEAMDADTLRRAALDASVFARASPEDKLRLVEALQAEGRVVAMTGDGVNDAPALRRANVGVAMGINGTEAAKEAAEMVLADDNFASITHAVEEGRTVYDNIRKSLMFILPTNGGQAFTIIGAVLLGSVLPITPLQILWVNMVTAVTLALALAFEPAESDVMRRPPRNPREPLLYRFLLWRILFVSAVLVAGTFGLFLWERAQGTGIEEARTIAVNTLVMFEVFYLFTTRFLWAPAYTIDGLFGSRYVLLAIALVLTLQMLFTYAPPMQVLFGTVAIDLETWSRILPIAFSVFILVELEKVIVRRWRGASE